jgi:PAS domain S-box-containing protein
VTRQFEVFHPALATWFDVSCYPMGSGIAVYLQDISQRRAEQSQLRLLQTAVARLNDTVVIAQALSESIETGSTPVVFVNEAFERCTGFTREDILNQDFVTILRDHLGPDEWARVSLAMGQWQPVRAEIAMTSKAGAEIWLEVDIAPIADDSGRFTHWVAVKRDVTGRRRDQQEILSLSHSLNQELEGRVQLRTAQLARSNHMLESFAYAVSHDLRSPLNTIAGFIELLRKADGAHVSPKGQHCLDRIAAGTRQMGELIGGLLTLAQLSRESPHLQTVDLSTMAERLAQQCQRQQPDRLAALHIQPGLQAQADPRLLEVVLHNLLDNAWKFSARQATVRIEVGSTTEADGECAFFVKDNGVGFDMAFQHKLFGTFERLHSPGEFKGTGIGLVTAQRVVESHGGRMWAHSAVGQGATFYFTLSARTKATTDGTTGSDVTVAVD